MWKFIEMHAMKEHIPILTKILPQLAVSSFIGCLKGKLSLMIFERYTNLKYKYGNQNFWVKGYYISTVSLNTKIVEEYIKNQESRIKNQESRIKKKKI